MCKECQRLFVCYAKYCELQKNNVFHELLPLKTNYYYLIVDELRGKAEPGRALIIELKARIYIPYF